MGKAIFTIGKRRLDSQIEVLNFREPAVFLRRGGNSRKLETEAALAQTWDAQAYGQNGAFVHELAGGVLEWLNAQPGEHILDLGCGDGQFTQRIAATGAMVQGVDASPEMVAAARSRGILADEASAESLPYSSCSFDAVCSNAALHWMRDQDAVLAEVRRVLKPGGRFVAEMGGHGNIAAIRVALMAVLAHHGYGDREDGVNYYPTAESYTRRLARKLLHVERLALIPRPTLLPETGMTGWLRTFRRGVLEGLPEEVRETVVSETEELLAPALRDEEGNWVADYVRLRFIARAI
jgi:SAM-dependent methyltransferase